MQTFQKLYLKKFLFTLIMPIDFDSYYANLNISHVDTFENVYDCFGDKENKAIHYLWNNEKLDGLTYYKIDQINLFYIILNIDNNGHYYYDHHVDRGCDIVSDFNVKSCRINYKLTYLIGELEYQQNEFNEFIHIAAQYHDFKIRFTFMETPNYDDVMILCYKKCILQNQIWRFLCKNSIVTKNIFYNYGLSKKIKNNESIELNDNLQTKRIKI